MNQDAAAAAAFKQDQTDASNWFTDFKHRFSLMKKRPGSS